MAIYLIDKIQQKNNGNFFLMDAEDIEYNGKALTEAIASGEFKGAKGDPGAKGADGSKVYFSNTALTAGAAAPSGTTANDTVIDSAFNVFTVDSGKKLVSKGNIKGAKGDKGDTGAQGPAGAKGETGQKGADGAPGVKGADGKSAYQIWLEQTGNAGKTETEYIASLKGAKGDTGAKGADGAMKVGTEFSTAEKRQLFLKVIE